MKISHPRSTTHDSLEKRIFSPFARGTALLAALAITVTVVGTAKADFLTPVAATAESYYSPDDRATGHAIDSTGMTPNSPVTASSTCGDSPGGTMWLSDGHLQTWITFDLGSVQTITGFHLWNYNENAVGCYQRSIKDCGIYAGTSLLADGSAYASAGAAWGTLVQNMTLTMAPGTSSYTGEDYTFTTPVTTRYLQIYVINNYGGYSGTENSYTGISEIRFYTQVGPPPAPTGLAAIPLHHGVLLNWTASAGATGYDVYRGTATGDYGPTPIGTTTSATTYTDMDVALVDGTPYYYVVKGTNPAGTGDPSNEVSESPSAGPVNQTLTFALGSAVTKTAADAPFSDTASAYPSGLAAAYSSDNSAVATVDASTGEVTLTGFPGTAHILADQAGNADFNAATQISQTLTVTQATMVITWATPVPVPFGTPLSGTQLNASSGGVDGTFVYDPPGGTVLALGTHTLSVQFTPANTVKYSTPAAKTVDILVTPAGFNVAFNTGNWSNSGIWSRGHVPQSDEDALILTGITVTKDNNQAANSVTVNSGGQLTALNVSNAFAGSAINLNGGTARFGRGGSTDPYVAGGNFVVQANSQLDSYNAEFNRPSTVNQFGTIDFAADGYQLLLADYGVVYNYNPSGVHSQFTGSIISHSGSIYLFVYAWGGEEPGLDFFNTSVRAGKTVTVTTWHDNHFTGYGTGGKLLGSLGVSTLGGAELLANNEVTLFQFPTSVMTLIDSSSFDTTNGLWTKSGTTTITATLGTSAGSIADGETASFSAANSGYVSLTGLTPDTTCLLTLALASAADQATVMAQLAKNPAFTTITAVGVDKVSLQFMASAATSYFVWDNVHTSFSDWYLGGDLTAVTLATGSLSGYTSWANGTFANGALIDKNPAHDPDGDGQSNQQEFAFGLDPTTGSSANPISQQLDKGTRIFKYTRTKDSGLNYIYQYSTTLSEPWADFTPDSAVSNEATPVEEITVTVPSSLLNESKLFLRVKAE